MLKTVSCVTSQAVQNSFQEESLSNFAYLLLVSLVPQSENMLVLFQIFYFLKDQ